MKVMIPVPANTQRLMDAQSSALLQQLVTATPAQVDSWMKANVTSLATAQTALTALALGIRYLYLKDRGD